MKHFVDNMRMMKLTAGDSKEVYYSQVVYVEELWWTPHTMTKKEIKEVVVASFYIKDSEIAKIKRAGNYLNLTWLEDTSMVFSALEFKEEFIFDDSVKTPEGTRVVITRKNNDIIEPDEEEEVSVTDKTKKKEPKLSPAHPVTFLQKGIMEECIEETYEKVKENVTVPMVPNMKQPINLAGHLNISIEEAKKVLEIIEGKKTHKMDIKTVEMGKYFLNIYKIWVVEIVERMKTYGYVRPIEVFVSQSDVNPYHIIINQDFIRNIVSTLTAEGVLWFTKKPAYNEVSDYNEFMMKMANFMTTRIDSIAEAVHEYGDIRVDTQKALDSMFKRKFYEPQQNAIEACIKSLEKQKLASIIGEMGTGKTSMLFGTALIHSTLKLKKAMKLLVLSPNHLIKSAWEQEINEISKDGEIHHVHNVSDLMNFEKEGHFSDDKNRVFVLSQSVSKDGYQYRPTVNWSAARRHFSCPCCGEVVKRKKSFTDPETKEKWTEMVPVSFKYFSTNQPTQFNYKCKSCKEVVWEPVNKNKRSKMIYSTALRGHFPRDAKVVERYIDELMYEKSGTEDRAKKKDLTEKIKVYRTLKVAIRNKKKEDMKRCSNTAPVADYIFKKMKHQFTHLILDEFHELQNNSKRGNAAGKLIHSVPYILCGTGTSMNGYADSRYRTDFMLQPELMKKYGYDYNSSDQFQVDFGVVENRWILKEDEYGEMKKKSLGMRKRPGISPVFFTLFMQGINVFVSMDDFKNEMPPMDYFHVPVEMDSDLKNAEKELREEILKKTEKDRKLHKSAWSMNYSFLDSPSITKQLKDKDGEVLIETPIIDVHKDNKLNELKRIIREEVSEHNNRVIVYTHYSSDKINDYYYKNLIAEGFKVTVLNPTGEKTISCDETATSSKGVEGVDREEYINNEAAKGTEVLIVNPSLIETGCNLTQFNTIIWTQMGFNLYTNRQADKRIYRLSTTRPCKVIYLYYKETVQQSVASLMASKIVASRSIEGHMDKDGLEELVSSRTAEEEMSQIFYEGISKGVEGVKKYKEKVA